MQKSEVFCGLRDTHIYETLGNAGFSCVRDAAMFAKSGRVLAARRHAPNALNRGRSAGLP